MTSRRSCLAALFFAMICSAAHAQGDAGSAASRQHKHPDPPPSRFVTPPSDVKPLAPNQAGPQVLAKASNPHPPPPPGETLIQTPPEQLFTSEEGIAAAGGALLGCLLTLSAVSIAGRVSRRRFAFADGPANGDVAGPRKELLTVPAHDSPAAPLVASCHDELTTLERLMKALSQDLGSEEGEFSPEREGEIDRIVQICARVLKSRYSDVDAEVRRAAVDATKEFVEQIERKFRSEYDSKIRDLEHQLKLLQSAREAEKAAPPIVEEPPRRVREPQLRHSMLSSQASLPSRPPQPQHIGDDGTELFQIYSTALNQSVSKAQERFEKFKRALPGNATMPQIFEALFVNSEDGLPPLRRRGQTTREWEVVWFDSDNLKDRLMRLAGKFGYKIIWVQPNDRVVTREQQVTGVAPGLHAQGIVTALLRPGLMRLSDGGVIRKADVATTE